MRAAIVYESVMGNTRQVAEAVAAGIRDAHPDATIWCGPASAASAETSEVDLVVAGAPTHFFGLPSRCSRDLWIDGSRWAERHGIQQAALEPETDGPGIREWLQHLAAVETGPCAATFDTRLVRPTSGAAARRIARRLRHLGYEILVEPEGFIVEGMEGPLRAGELERARRWAAHLARHREVMARSAPR
jgi:hypothetical protein